MKTLLLSLLCLFVWNQTTEALTDQQVVLGQSVTLACEYRLKGVIWFVMKLPARPEMILRTFGTGKAEYYDEKFRENYSEGDRSQSVMVSDCTPLKSDMKFGDPFRPAALLFLRSH
ncbi:hypothetical protein QQF64_019364 [Cirrhinus molitorella]|uniref:Immunoglobulin V-set domain-containing protein n=1 Tax=Cirrhinus molitorella TaxID=172907 RepID=A0ABR3LJB1_9TELE